MQAQLWDGVFVINGDWFSVHHLQFIHSNAVIAKTWQAVQFDKNRSWSGLHIIFYYHYYVFIYLLFFDSEERDNKDLYDYSQDRILASHI